VQFAIQRRDIYVLEVNPRASRTVPFVAKTIGLAVAGIAAKVMAGEKLRAFNLKEPSYKHIAVKEAVFPFARFPEVDPVLGPEMRSTGEVMGVDASFGMAFAKAQAGAYGGIPTSGSIFVSVANRDKRHMIFPIKRLADLGFQVLATAGTARVLERNGVRATVVRKHSEGPGPDGEPTIVGRILAEEVDLVVNTPHGVTSGGSPRVDGYDIRTAAVMRDIPCITTIQGLAAAVQGIEALQSGAMDVRSLQSWSRALYAHRTRAERAANGEGSAS
jgi:carbamoyl-phosphate synthase large subunit